jgi:hypothetical protein
LSLIEQRGEFVASLPQAVAAEAGQWIFAANDHAQYGITPFEVAAGLAFSPSRGQFSAQLDEATDDLGQVVIDLVRPVVERAVESRNCRTAAIGAH